MGSKSREPLKRRNRLPRTNAIWRKYAAMGEEDACILMKYDMLGTRNESFKRR
jgi:hypothetical protein